MPRCFFIVACCCASCRTLFLSRFRPGCVRPLTRSNLLIYVFHSSGVRRVNIGVAANPSPTTFNIWEVLDIPPPLPFLFSSPAEDIWLADSSFEIVVIPTSLISSPFLNRPFLLPSQGPGRYSELCAARSYAVVFLLIGFLLS